MAHLVSDENRDRFLTVGWNNILALSAGVPAVAFAFVALTSDVFSDRTAFIGLVIVSAFD